jgi:hypothetical protein
MSRQTAIVYYRKDASWLAHSPLDPPVEDSPDSLVEVYREKRPMHVRRCLLHADCDGLLESIWTKLQNVDSPDGDLPAELGVRSMMHGDMILVGSFPPDKSRTRAWQCEMVGWREVRPEWLVKGDFPKPFPELMSCHEESSQEDATS